MAKGKEAKERVIEKIKNTFGQDYLGIDNNKVYIWSEEGGERIQVALSLTCPKIPYGGLDSMTVGNKLDFSKDSNKNVSSTEISPSEKENIEMIMRALNI